jgi:hypothetical protein
MTYYRGSLMEVLLTYGLEFTALPDFATEELPGFDTKPAWQAAVSTAVQPACVIRYSADTPVQVRHSWLELSRRTGVISADNRVLISINGMGLIREPWRAGRLREVEPVADPRFEDWPEFVAASVDGKRYSAVTSEEGEVWVVTGDLA